MPSAKAFFPRKKNLGKKCFAKSGNIRHKRAAKLVIMKGIAGSN